MRKSIFVLCAVLLAAFATGAGAEEIYLPGGVSALTVGIEAALTLPSTISLTEVSWVIDDETILELINSNNTSCTVKPLKEGSTIVKAVGKDSSGTPKQVGPTIVKVVAAGSDDANSDETDGNSDSDSSGDSSGSGSTDSQPLGTRAQLTVGTPVRFFIPTTASFTSAEWSFEPQSRVGEPVYADNKASCTVTPLSSGPLTVTATLTDTSGKKSTIKQPCVVLSTGDVIDVTVDTIASQSVSVKGTKTLKPKVSLKLNDTQLDIPYALAAVPLDESKVQVDVLSGVTLQLKGKAAGTTSVKVVPTLTGVDSSYVNLPANVSFDVTVGGGGSSGGSGGCDAGLGLGAVFAVLAFAPAALVKRKKIG